MNIFCFFFDQDKSKIQTPERSEQAKQTLLIIKVK